jgi:sulfite exporter TauE/SafE
MGPYMVSTDDAGARLEGRWSTVGPAFRVLGWYNLGRLLAYLAAGVVASLLAGSGSIPPAVHAAALLLTAVLLVVAVIRPDDRDHHCWLGKARRRSAGAFVIGVLQGLSPCPPFLIAVGLALSAPGVLGGTLLFLALFAGTALYTLPLAFLEPLRRRRWLFVASRVVGALVALYLVGRAVLLVV